MKSDVNKVIDRCGAVWYFRLWKKESCFFSALETVLVV